MAFPAFRDRTAYWAAAALGVLLTGSIVATGFAAADSPHKNSGVLPVGSTITERVTVIYEDPDGKWPGGDKWIGRTACSPRLSNAVADAFCPVVINAHDGIDV